MIPGATGARPWIAFGTCCLIWGSTFLFIKIGNDTMPPVWAAAIRLVAASLLLGAIARVLGRRFPRGPELRASLWFGLINFGIGMPLLYWGEREVPSGVATVMYATIPLTTALFAWGFGLEKLRPGTMAAAVLAIVGVAMITSAPLGAAVSAAAMIAVVLASVTASLSGVMLKRAPGADPFASNSIANAVGGAVCLAVSAALGESWEMPPNSAWLPLLYLVVVGSVGAFVTFVWLVQRWPVSRISFISVVTPVVGTALGALVLGETLSRGVVTGTVIVIAAVLLGIGTSLAAARTRQGPTSSV